MKKLVVILSMVLVVLRGVSSAAVMESFLVNQLPPEAVRALANGTEFILYSLDPGDPNVSLTPPKPGPLGSLNDFKILGLLRLTDRDHTLTTALITVNELIQAKRRDWAMCFSARHALRVVSNKEVFDFMICFQCHQIRLYQHGKVTAITGIPDKPEALNALLSAAKIPLAAPPARK